VTSILLVVMPDEGPIHVVGLILTLGEAGE
jgi:hypothetical protein